MDYHYSESDIEEQNEPELHGASSEFDVGPQAFNENNVSFLKLATCEKNYLQFP